MAMLATWVLTSLGLVVVGLFLMLIGGETEITWIWVTGLLFVFAGEAVWLAFWAWLFGGVF
jgi:hypothetical protein